jgi:hypothetical protein
VLALGRPGARSPGVAPPPMEPPQPPALAGVHAPEGHLPQEPPRSHPRSPGQILSHYHPHCAPMLVALQ